MNQKNTHLPHQDHSRQTIAHHAHIEQVFQNRMIEMTKEFLQRQAKLRQRLAFASRS